MRAATSGASGSGTVAPPRPGGSALFDRITVDPERMAGVPCVRGTRVPVSDVLDLLADGRTPADLIAAIPELELEDITQALRYAAAVVRDHASGRA